MTVSKLFTAASLQHCKWIPCPAAVSSSEEGWDVIDLPAVVGGWSEGAKQNILAVGDIRRQQCSNEIVSFQHKLSAVHPGTITDLQVACVQDTLVAASSSSTGSLSLLLMQVPPEGTTADLQFLAVDAASSAEESTSYLQELSLHSAPVASVDINSARQLLLSVSGDGSICLTPLEFNRGQEFKAANGWSGYSQGRWVDSHTFATSGVLGGLQLWDERSGPSPVSRSPSSWGPTGCAALDAQQEAAQQLLCLAVHPSRPNLAATGATGGSIAMWDLRFQSAPLALTRNKAAAGDVWQCMFDTSEVLLSTAATAVPPLLYCTSDGALCAAHAAAAGSSQAGSRHGWAAGGSSSNRDGRLVAQVLQRETYSINSFDVEPAAGQDIVAATGDEHLLLLHRESDM